MSLDNFSNSSTGLHDSVYKPEKSAVQLLGDAALYELDQSAIGFAQNFGVDKHLPRMDAPSEAESTVGRNAQMLGRGLGNFLPTLGVAIATKFAFGKLLSPALETSENLLLKRSAIGLNIAESTITGVATGALLKPTDQVSAGNWSSFVMDRASSGLNSGLSFALLTSMTFGLNRVATSKLSQSIGTEALIKAAPVNGLIAGAASGFVSTETGSLVNTGTFTNDRDKIYSAMYESGVMGGLFGFTSLIPNRSVRSEFVGKASRETSVHATSEDTANPRELAPERTALVLRPVNLSGQIKTDLPEEYVAKHSLFATDHDEQQAVADLSGIQGLRSRALDRLETVFGVDSPTIFGLMNRELDDFFLAGISRFINKDPKNHAEVVRNLVNAGADEKALDPSRLDALSTLQNHFADEPTVMSKLSSANLDGQELKLIAGLVEMNPEIYGRVLADQVKSGEPTSQRLDPSRLFVIADLTKLFGTDSPTLTALLSREKAHPEFLHSLDNFIKESPKSRLSLIEEMVRRDTPITHYDFEALETQETFAGILKNDPETFDRIRKYGFSDYELDGVADFVKESPETRVPLLRRLMAADPQAGTLSYDNLDALEQFESQLGGDNVLGARVFSRLTGDSDAYGIVGFVKKEPVAHAQFLKKLLDLGATSKAFSDLPSLQSILRAVPGDDQTARGLIELENRGVSISGIAKLLNDKPDIFVPVLKDLINGKEIQSSISHGGGLNSALWDRALAQYVTDPKNDKLHELGLKLSPGTLGELVEFLAEKPKTRGPIFENLLNAGFKFETMDIGKLKGLDGLSSYWKPGSETFKRFADSKNLNLEDLAAFANESPNNVALIEKQLQSGADDDRLSSNRLQALSSLGTVYGADSKTFQRLLQYEDEGSLDIAGLSEFVESGGSRAVALLAKTVYEVLPESDARLNRLTPDQLNGVMRLNKIFGENSAQAIKLNEYGSSVDMRSLADFVDHPLELESRKSMVGELLSGDAMSSALNGDRLNAMRSLEQDFPPSTMRILTEQEKQDPNLFQAMEQVIHRSPGAIELVNKLVDLGVPGEQITAEAAKALITLKNSLHLDDATIKRIAELSADGMDYEGMHRFLERHSSTGPAIVEELIKQGAEASEFSALRLDSYKGLIDTFGGDSARFARMLDLEKNDRLSLYDVTFFINIKPTSRKELIGRMLDIGFDGKAFTRDRMGAYEILEETFGKDSPEMQRIDKIVLSGGDLLYLDRFIGLQNGQSAVREALQNNIAPQDFNYYHFDARANLEQTYGKGSEITSKLFAMLDDDQLRGTAGIVRLGDKITEFIKDTVASGGDAKSLEYKRLRAYSSLLNNFSPHSREMQRITELEKQGLSVIRLDNATKNDEMLVLARDLLLRGAPAAQFRTENLIDRSYMDKLKSALDPQIIESDKIDRMQTQGLSVAKLYYYVSESPASRKPIVSELLKKNSDTAILNDLSRLNVLPPSVALKLIEESRVDGMSVPKILERLKDWDKGKNFRDRLIDQVRNGLPLSEASVQTLFSGVSSEMKVSNAHLRESDEELNSAEPKPTEDNEQLSKTIVDAAKRIDERVPKDRPLVLLGRDMWTMLPYLRERGRNPQYFLWSRLQIQDKRTAEQWRKEIPPNAVVIDTGYNGSIIDDIKRVDGSVDGYLLSRNGSSKYPQLLVGGDHRRRATSIEQHSKLIGSGKTYSENGGAIITKSDVGEADVQYKGSNEGKHRYLVESDLRSLFKIGGLDTWTAWRYSQYLGLTPAERIGLRSKADVQSHYEKVEQLRNSL